MSKSDYPALRMRVERGRLVPAGQFDQERLDSYRPGAIVMCRMTEEKDRVLVKKWFAIIGLVLKTCETPWKNKDEAHEAIKLALGIVNLSKTVTGQWMQYPKSLTELDDPEMSDALAQMTELLSHMTGVDVETLRKETDHIKEEHPQSDAADSPTGSSEADDTPPALPSSAAEEAEAPPSASASSIIECAKEMLALAVLSYPNEKDREDALHQCLEDWAARLPDSQAMLDDISVAVRAVITKNPEKNRSPKQAREWLSGRLGTTAEQLGDAA